MRWGLTARTLAASGVLALVVAGAFVLVLAATDDLRDSARESRRAERVSAGQAELQRLLVDLQTASRGFAISGDRGFLVPLEEARRRIPLVTAQLESLVVSDQRARLESIERDIADYQRTWLEPTIALAERDRRAAADRIASGRGNRRVDALRRQFDELAAIHRDIADARSERVDDSARRAIALGAAGLAGSAVLILLLALHVSRSVSAPVRRLALAAGRVAQGDLAARVPERGAAEVGSLNRAFNVMAGSLEEARDEAESRNAELEAQQAELEAANDELEAQQAELERALTDLGAERDRADAVSSFTRLLAAERHEGDGLLEQRVLHALGDFAGAEIAAIYSSDAETENGVALRAARGLDTARLPTELEIADGLPGRALAERRPVLASHGETGLRVAAFGDDVAVRHELHLPLELGERVLGVVTLGRIADRPFTPDDVEALTSLAAQTAITISNRNAFVRSRRLANINRAVLDATVDAIALVDSDGHALVTNAAMARMRTELFGLRDEPAPGDDEDVAARMTDPDRYRAVLEAARSDPDLDSLDEFRLTESGRAIQRYTTPVRDSSGEAIGRMFLLRDVTAEREAEELKTQLVATVSHELRTPLASIVGFSELMTLRELPVETHVRYARTIHQEAQRLTALINDFLDLQRIEQGTFTLRLEPFDLDDVLRSQAEVFAHQSASHEIRLPPTDEALVVVGQRDRIAQVVANLLSNAIKYSPDGGPVEVAAVAIDDLVRVEVRDHGLGIPVAEQPKIFQKFFRVDTSDAREIGGTGLGLALCREIVLAHGGRIGFESEEGSGSTFWFELQRARERPRARGAGRILVIEDDPSAAMLIEQYLVIDRYETEVVATGEEGLARAVADPPALICLDITLAGELDGWQVLARLKSNEVTERIPVLVCTAAEDGREEAAVLGAADFLAKPFSAEVLRETVFRQLGPGPRSVLIVEDDPAARNLMRATLAGDRLRLVEAADGEEALAAVARDRPDAIVLDLMLPKVDGFEVLERMQANPATRAIPVVVVTAKRLTPGEHQLLQHRATALLEKSRWSAEEFRRAIARALAAERLRATA